MHVERLHLLYSCEEIHDRVADIAAQINREYADKPLVVLCVLKGAFMFFSDLVKHLDCKPALDFIRLSSYALGTTAGNITITKDTDLPLEGKHVLVVEDIVDTGHSMHFLLNRLAARGAKSLRLATLIDKHERREVPVHADFVGFTLSDGFIVGYGLDYAECYRELPALYIAEVTEDAESV